MEKDRFRNKLLKTVETIYSEWDIFVTCILALVAGFYGIFGGKIEYMMAGISGVIVVMTVTILKERRSRSYLIKEVEKLSTTISADNFFSTKSSDLQIISKAKQEIVLIQESGQLITETCRQFLIEFLNQNPEGRIRIITVIRQSPIVELMAFRNANLSPELMLKRLTGGIDMIKVLINSTGENANRIEVRFFPYPLDFTAVFIDSEHTNFKNREALIRLQGFKVVYDDKLDFLISKYHSNSVYEFYKNQMNKIWLQSTKCILLSGKPGIGKSTALRKIVSELIKSKSNISGFITQSKVDSNGNRTSFITSTIDGSKSGVLSEKIDNKYELNRKTMNEIVIPALEAGITSSEILVIDEIGPIQLQSTKFKELVKVALNTPALSIIGTISLIDTWPDVAEFHYHERTGIIEMNENNRHYIENLLHREFIHFDRPNIF